ncbi:MAG: TIGR01777 family oxidoreductase [Flavobacteriales bacterium]
MDEGLSPSGFPRRVLITGATGLVGRALLRRLSLDRPETEIRLLGRSARGIREWEGIPVQGFGWNPVDGALDAAALDGVDCIVHLAGETVAQRWSPAVKGSIRDSRIASLSLLEQACRRVNVAPRLVSASAIGWYPSADHVQRESDPVGSGFIAEVVRDWEAAAASLGALGGGHAALRTGLVLATGGGVLGKLVPLYRLGLGSPLSPGTQWQSWIHIDDLVSLFLASMEQRQWEGAFNAVSPNPIRQQAFSRSLAQALGRPHILPSVPQWAIRLLYGEAANALLASHRILPARTLAAGFKFQHENLDVALQDILR